MLANIDSALAVLFRRNLAFVGRLALLVGLLSALLSTALGVAARAEPGLFDLSAYRGKVVYLDFWASWCGPCKQSFPYMMGLQRKYGADGLVVIAVNLDKDASKAQAFLKETGSTLPIVYDPNGALPTKYKIKDMPSAVLIGKDGRARFTHNGFFETEQSVYEAHISELMHEK